MRIHRMHQRFGDCLGVCLLLAMGPAAMPTWAQGPGATPGAEKVKQAQLRVTFSAGHKSPQAAARRLRLSGRQIEILGTRGEQLAGDYPLHEGVAAVLHYDERPAPVPQPDKHGPVWADLIRLSDADTARRLRDDMLYHQDPRRLTVQLGGNGDDGGGGFTVTVEQLLRNKAFWIPALDLYLAVGDAPLPLEQHRKELAAFQGRRVLDQVHAGPEASYEQYKALWEDMGSPHYQRVSQPAPGHVVCLSWDSSLRKFGVERFAGVWNDYGNQDCSPSLLRLRRRPQLQATAIGRRPAGDHQRVREGRRAATRSNSGPIRSAARRPRAAATCP